MRRKTDKKLAKAKAKKKERKNTYVDKDTINRLFDENKEVMDWLKDK